jgi:phage tail-like protein
MATDKRNDPFRTYNFTVEIDGENIGGFSEVSGLNAEGNPVDYREGSDLQQNVRRLPGFQKFDTVVLRRGKTLNPGLWEWYQALRKGKPDRREVTITLLNEERLPMLRWSIENAWISKIEGPTFKAASNEVAMESVNIVHEGLTLEVVG